MKKTNDLFRTKWHQMTLQRKLISMFIFVSMLILVVNLFAYSIINDMSKGVQNIYESNVTLNTLSSSLELTQESMKELKNQRLSFLP